MKVGIDLGTTYSAVAYIDEDGKAQIIPNCEDSHTTPSVVVFDEDTVLVGKYAKEQSKAHSEDTVQFVKRQMGTNFEYFANDTTYKSEDISSLILKKVIQDSEEFLNQKITSAVITVPAYFNDLQRQATERAGILSGVKVLKIINEPTAAAIAYGINSAVDQGTILVYDLGGGTFDVTLLKIKDHEFEVIASDGFKNKGGFDIDNLLVAKVADIYEKTYGESLLEDTNALQQLQLAAEDAKIRLSKMKKVKISLTANSKPIDVPLTRDEFEEMIAQFVDDTREKVIEVLESVNYTWDKIDKVLLIGGSSKIPLVKKMMEELSGKTIDMSINPDEAVAMGAAYFANTIPEQVADVDGSSTQEKDVKNRFVIKEVTSHGLGVIVANSETREKYNDVIIKKNTSIPTTVSKQYKTTIEGQRLIRLRITQGDDRDLDYVEKIGEAVLTLEPHPQGSPLLVTIELDEQQMAHVYLKDLVTGKDVGEMNIERPISMTAEEIESKKTELDALTIA